MNEYPKFIEHPYKVYTGEAEYVMNAPNVLDFTGVIYSYNRSFRFETDAEAYAERMAEDFEFVKIEKKENI